MLTVMYRTRKTRIADMYPNSVLKRFTVEEVYCAKFVYTLEVF